MCLDHIGIAVESLDTAREQYAKIFGVAPSPIEEVPAELVRVSFFELEGCRVELLEATSAESPIRKFLDRGRTGVHHICFALGGEKISSLAGRLEADGVTLTENKDGEKIRGGSGESEVLFLHPASAAGVLIEFSQKRGDDA